MYKVVIGENEFCLTNPPEISDSSREVSFSDLEILFDDFKEEDLPIQYEEVIVKMDEEELFRGYVDTVDFPEFRFNEQPFIISISLISPQTYASKRVRSIEINALPLGEALERILQPLIDDGFVIEENLTNGREISQIFKFETLEKILNFLSNRFNFIWYIDKNKKIFIKDIGEIEGQTPAISLTENNKQHLKSIKPKKTITDYTNKLNVKDVILVSEERLLPNGTVLEEGTTYNFKFPISISENVGFRFKDRETVFMFSLTTNVTQYWVLATPENKTTFISGDIGFSGEDETKLLLITDSNDRTKITGFRWNAPDETIISGDVLGCFSDTVLKPYNCVYIDPHEAKRISVKTNTTGFIEKVVSANGRYFLFDELQEYARGLFKQNNTLTSDVKCVFKGYKEDMLPLAEQLRITNLININLPKFLISGEFVVTDTLLVFNRETVTLTINARNSNLNESFTDIFRRPIPQSSTDELVNSLSVIFIEDDKVIVNKEVYVNGEVVTDV